MMFDYLKQWLGFGPSKEELKYLDQMRQEYEMMRSIEKHWLAHVLIIDPLYASSLSSNARDKYAIGIVNPKAILSVALYNV